MDITTKTEVSGTELAAVLGVTGRRIQQLAQDGIIESDKGKYLLTDAVQKYIEYRMKEKALSAAEKEKLDADVSIKKAKAIVSVLEAKELQGKMHRSEDVAAMTEDLIYTIRGMLMALPGRLAVDVAAISSPAEAAEFIRKEIHKVMGELSHYQYDAKKYNERVRERRSWDTGNKSDTDDD
ncbi:MAG: hypothetical protein K0R50_407 [Eubacterium sp.]|jgi:phage terminase Nu1 subunit (DNA packaging protein)|nr:hypothetical protein [Eubacterium sp.]